MAKGNVTKLSLKAVINKQKSKVLFAEADSDFADVLVSFLTLPLGKIVRILEKHYGSKAPVIGSFSTLYTGLVNLDNKFFYYGCGKTMLVDPKSSSESECRKLVLDISDSQHTKYFVCQDSKCPKSIYNNISLYSDICNCNCGKSLNRQLVVERALDSNSDGGFISRGALSFIVTDDLRVVPIVTGFIETLNDIGITDIDGVELRSLSFGINDIIELLKFSLISATPLTDLILKDRQTKSSTVKRHRSTLLHHMEEEVEHSKILLKVSLQKSTNKFLFAQANEEFVEFLLSLLIIPLGKVCYLLEGKTSLGNINNIYSSVRDVIDVKNFETSCTKEKLINPKLPHGYTSKINHFLPLTEEIPPKLYYQKQLSNSGNASAYNDTGRGLLVPHFKWNGDADLIVENALCFVTDDLTVSTGIGKSISILNRLGIPLSDMKEMDLHIGLEEALNILKASLTSTTALTDALVKPMLSKMVDQITLENGSTKKKRK